jgi:hypothetical protein
MKLNEIKINDKILMHGFSASGNFTNRFTALHPELIKASASGGVNATPILPIDTYKNNKLIYPIGVYDFNIILGNDFDKLSYSKVPQFIYMGALDTNDTLPYSECFSEHERWLIINTLHRRMMPYRWDKSKKLINTINYPIQMVTYDSTAHEIKEEMLNDIIRFFKASMDGTNTKIKPYSYPKTELKTLNNVYINGLFWRGSKSIPDVNKMRELSGSDFIISISDWIDYKNYRQLSEFKDDAGFNFEIRSLDNKTKTLITTMNFAGTMSMGDGTFQGFVVKLDQNQLSKLKSQQKYKIIPKNKSNKYKWRVKKSVYLIKP